MLLNVIWFRVLFYFIIMIIGIKTLLPYQQQYLQSLQQLKVMKQFRNRIENNKINRHSSQLAIRKTSVHSSTPRDSQSDIQNIRQTTFWMKKTIGAPSGQSCNPQNNKKMIYEGRNRQIFSMKVNTENSETDSTCNQKRGDQRDEADENSKLVLIEKSQKQLVQQANILINENLPKLVSCQHLFNSLNKSLKMALKNCSRVLGSQMQRIFDRHIQITTCIFEKVANHTNDFINSQKCAHLISKIMQLEKENSKLMTFCQELQIKLEKQKNNSQTQNNVQMINLRKINIERILSQNYKFGEKQASSLKSQNLCKSLIKPLISVNGNRQVAYFQSTSTVFVQLMSSKQGQFLLRQVWNEQKNKNGVKSNRSISLDKMMLMDILKSAVDFDILALVKSKAHILLHRTKYQTSIKQQKVDMGIVLSILNKLSILKDPIKKKQIIIKLLELLNITQFEGMRKQIETMIDDNFSHIYSSAMRSTTAHNKSVNEQESKASVCDKISRLSQKRFVNCANLYQRKKKKNTRQGQQVSQNHQTGSVKAKFQISLAAEEIVLLSYYFVVWQLEFLSEASLTLTKLNLDEPVDQNMSDKILAPQLSQSIRMNGGREVEKESIFVLANAVSKAYGDQFVVKQQSREQAVRELTSLIKQQILALLSKQKRLVLSELSNQNCQ